LTRVPVFNADGTSLTPTTPGNARKLVRDGAARRVYEGDRFLGLQMTRPLGSGRNEPPIAANASPQNDLPPGSNPR